MSQSEARDRTPGATRVPRSGSQRVALAVTIAAALPVVAVVYLLLPHLFPGVVATWAYQGSWLVLILMAVALGLLQLSVLHNYMDLRQQVGRLVTLAEQPSRPEDGEVQLGEELQTVLNQARGTDLESLVREFNRIVGLVQQQASQVDQYARRFEAVNEELRSSNLRLREMSLTDDLTEVGNRRNFDVRIREEINRSTRFGHAFSLLLLDIDSFKRFNDDFGHLSGDAALRGLGSLMRSISREGDVPCRVGGEEFAFILPETGKADGLAFAERIRRGVEESLIAPDRSRTLTVSIGLAAFPDDGKTQEDLLRAADEALYQSKHDGRNRVTPFVRK